MDDDNNDGGIGDFDSGVLELDTRNVENLLAVLTTNDPGEKGTTVTAAAAKTPLPRTVESIDIIAWVKACNERVMRHMEDDTPTMAYAEMAEASFNVLYRSQLREVIGFKDSGISVIPEYVIHHSMKRVDIAIIDDKEPRQSDGVLAIIELKYVRMGFLRYRKSASSFRQYTPAIGESPLAMLEFLSDMHYYMDDLASLSDPKWQARNASTKEYESLDSVMHRAKAQVRDYGQMIKHRSKTKKMPLLFAAVGVGLTSFVETVAP
jgi:hypothetical protein